MARSITLSSMMVKKYYLTFVL